MSNKNQPTFSVGTVTSVPVKQLTAEEYNQLKQKYDQEHKDEAPIRGYCGTMDIYQKQLQQQQQQQQQNQQQQTQQHHHIQQQQHM